MASRVDVLLLDWLDGSVRTGVATELDRLWGSVDEGDVELMTSDIDGAQDTTEDFAEAGRLDLRVVAKLVEFRPLEAMTNVEVVDSSTFVAGASRSARVRATVAVGTGRRLLEAACPFLTLFVSSATVAEVRARLGG